MAGMEPTVKNSGMMRSIKTEQKIRLLLVRKYRVNKKLYFAKNKIKGRFHMYTVQYMKQLRRQVNQHDCLPSLLGDGDIWIEIVYDEGKIFWTVPTIDQPRHDKNLLYKHTTSPTNKPRKETRSFALFRSPFISVSTGSRGHLSLVSLLKAKYGFRRGVPLYRELRDQRDDKSYLEVNKIIMTSCWCW